MPIDKFDLIGELTRSVRVFFSSLKFMIFSLFFFIFSTFFSFFFLDCQVSFKG